MRWWQVTLSLLCVLTLAHRAATRTVPTIGILGKPLAEEHYDVRTKLTKVVEAKYVRYIEGGGAKPTYIDYNSTDAELAEVFSKINGLLLIGGATDLVRQDPASGKYLPTLYMRKAELLVRLAVRENENGGYFPVWGTCLGYEVLVLALGKDYGLLRDGCDCYKYNAVLEFTETARNSRLYSHFAPRQISWLATVPMTYNSHSFYVSADDFRTNPHLAKEVRVLSTSRGKNGTFSFVSSIEAVRYPFYAVQFHPEKNGYDFNPHVPSTHVDASIEAMQRYADFFVDEARHNGHSFDSDEEEARHSVYRGQVAFESFLGPLYLFP